MKRISIGKVAQNAKILEILMAAIDHAFSLAGNPAL
jgi:hypothetical protein